MVQQNRLRNSRGATIVLPERSLSNFQAPAEVIQLLAESVARENTVLPLAFDGETLHVAVADIDDIATQDKIRFILNVALKAYAFPRFEVVDAIDRHYEQVEGTTADSMLQEFCDTQIDFSESEMDAVVGKIENLGNRSLRSTKLAAFGSKTYDPGDSMFYYTIEEGEQVLARHRSGRIEVLVGPKRVWKGRTRFERMEHFVAHPRQYLEVRFRDGKQENLPGPVEVWADPRIHQAIDVRDGLSLAAKEAVVVYGHNGSQATVRRVIHGPGNYVPQPGEWLHNFSWHASHGGSRGAEKKPNSLKFQKLWLMPDQMYHDVHDVRTSDDAVLTIRLMIFFELIDIDRMLDTTHDPIGDFVNAATSDVVGFTGKRSFEEFKQSTERLNMIETYQQLLHRAEQCGYRIRNVVYRGYGAPHSLQTMHDEAIQSRTRLQLERATERQAQELEDYKLQCQMERSARRREEQTAEIEHDLDLKRRRHAEQLRQTEAAGLKARQERQLEAQLSAQISAVIDTQQRAHLTELRNLQVDLTALLTQGRADQVIELRGADGRPHVHLDNKIKTAQPRDLKKGD